MLDEDLGVGVQAAPMIRAGHSSKPFDAERCQRVGPRSWAWRENHARRRHDRIDLGQGAIERAPCGCCCGRAAVRSKLIVRQSSSDIFIGLAT